LAGDTLKAAADLKMPMVGVTLLNNQGYFKQIINKNGEQEEEPDNYDYSKLKKTDAEAIVSIEGNEVKVGAWKYEIKGEKDYFVPVYFLDTDIEGNNEEYRNLTGNLYGGDDRYRFMQEIILGRGGVKILSSLGYEDIQKYHLNEGHAALAVIEIFSQFKPRPLTLTSKRAEEIIEKIREKCIFTTHTPVEAGHDIFPLDLVENLQPEMPYRFPGLIKKDFLNMSHLAAYFSFYINGVSRKHQKVSTEILPDYKISSITNGVHSKTWTSPEFKELFDKYIPGWRSCSLSLRNAFNISPKEIWDAHQKTKKRLLDYVEEKTGKNLSEDIFTIGFARRFATYKRPTLLFNDMDELIRIHKEVGRMQIIIAGKAHPKDSAGKQKIKEVHEIMKNYENDIDIVFLPDYDMRVAKLLIPGVDIWLNTPLPPNEGSGTSGMKAAHNGVPHFSTLDGWWLEGFIDRKTGWSIGKKEGSSSPEELTEEDSADLYYRLEDRILPRYYNTPDRWRETMRHTIAINASFFNSERMLRQYAQEAYLQK